jgi:hypothetical protein
VTFIPLWCRAESSTFMRCGSSPSGCRTHEVLSSI